jgi:hypothetical protein
MDCDPWLKANECERAEALAVAAEYGSEETITVEELAARFETRPRRVRQARWLAQQGGMLVRLGPDKYRYQPRSKEITG